MELSHFDENGNLNMVDTSMKKESLRAAIAEGHIKMEPATLALLKDRKVEKGDALTLAKAAGIMAAKDTSSIIPLCHPIRITHCDITYRFEDNRIVVNSSVRSFDRTGAEMEALMAVSIALLTIYDMLKAADKDMIISGISLVKKSGGASGTYIRHEDRQINDN